MMSTARKLGTMSLLSTLIGVQLRQLLLQRKTKALAFVQLMPLIGAAVYVIFENIDGFKRVFGFEPNTKIAVFVFGLFHGLGLATKLQEFDLSENGLVTNIISFNIGVEIGQILALSAVFLILSVWRTSSSYLRHSFITNTALMTGGFLLAGFQFSAYLLQPLY